MRSARVELILDTLRAVRSARDLSKETDRVADALGDTARQGQRAGQAVDEAGAEMSEAARAAAAMDRQIEQLTGSLREMAIQQALTGADFGKQMREQEAQLARAARSRKLLGDQDAKQMGVQLGATLGVSTARGFFTTLSATLKGGPHMAAIMGAAGAAAAPTFIGAMSAAMTAGAGAGVLGIGIMALADDPAVGTAAGIFGNKLLRGIRVEAERSLRTPVVAALSDLQGVSTRVAHNMGDAFAELDDDIGPLVGKLGQAAEMFSATLAGAASRSGPALDALGDSVLLLTDGVTYFIDTLSRGGPEAAENLRMIAGGLGDVLKFTANTLDGLNRAGNMLANNPFWAGPLLPFMKKRANDAAAANDQLATATWRVQPASYGAANGLEQYARMQGLAEAGAEDLKTAQQGLKDVLQAVGAESSVAKQRADALKQTMDSLYGATIRNADANQNYHASWDTLTDSVKANKRSLDVHTAAGRSNRTALVGLLKSSNDLYISNVEAGQSTDSARKKHEARTRAIREESRRLGLNKGETERLITTYGRIPKKKTTDLVLRSVENVADALLDLAAVQLHLAKGTPLRGDLRRRLMAAQYGMPDTKRAHGGPLPGHAPHDRADNMVYAGTPGEWVIQRPTVRRVERQFGPGAMAHFNRHGELPGMEKFASGGLLRASRANWGANGRRSVTTGMTRVPSMNQVIAKVIPMVPSGTTGPWMERMLERRFGVNMISGFRRGSRTLSGNLSYHALNRAVDFPPMRAMAEFMYRNYKPRLREAITPYQQFNVHNGRDRHWSGAVWRQHAFGYGNAHNHFAMDSGGVVREPVFGVGRSGATYSFGENGRPERVTPLYQSGQPAAAAPAVNAGDLARAVAAALHGVTVTMDGRVVGQIQGRNANLLARTG